MELPDAIIDAGDGLRYLLRVPRHSATDKFPVLCFLHGCNEGAPTEIGTALTRHGPLHHDNRIAPADRFIIIAPQLPQRGDLWYRFGDSVQQIVTHLHQSCSGDPLRSYLTGFSFGANGVFDLALEQPQTWAALWAVDPTRVPRAKLPQPLWLSFGELARPRKNQFIEMLSLPPYSNRSDQHAVFEDRGADHVGSARMAYRDERIYQWLLSKRLP